MKHLSSETLHQYRACNQKLQEFQPVVDVFAYIVSLHRSDDDSSFDQDDGRETLTYYLSQLTLHNPQLLPSILEMDEETVLSWIREKVPLWEAGNYD